MTPVGVVQPVLKCACGRIVVTGRVHPREHIICPRCGRDCSVAPALLYRLRYFLYMLKKKVRGLSQLSIVESWQLPRERRRYRDNQALKAERTRTGDKRLGQTAYSKDDNGTSRDFGCHCAICEPPTPFAGELP